MLTQLERGPQKKIGRRPKKQTKNGRRPKKKQKNKKTIFF
jgi:hypothetical protein